MAVIGFPLRLRSKRAVPSEMAVTLCPHCGQWAPAHPALHPSPPPRSAMAPPTNVLSPVVVLVPGSRARNTPSPALAAPKVRSVNSVSPALAASRGANPGLALATAATQARETKASGWLFLAMALVVFLLGFSWVFGLGFVFLASLLGG